jgi:hypothetical protein
MANLTSKELSALEDQLNYEQILVKKFHTFASGLSDPQLRTKCEQVAAKHQDHFNRLMNYLN